MCSRFTCSPLVASRFISFLLILSFLFMYIKCSSCKDSVGSVDFGQTWLPFITGMTAEITDKGLR